MKLFRSNQFRLHSVRRTAAMTMVETMVAMGVFVFVFLGLIYTHIFGLRYDSVVGSKLGASDQSRMALGRLMNEIRAAKSYDIGNMSGNTFIADPTNNALQVGTALRLFLTSSTSNYVQYYLDAPSTELRRTETGFAGYNVVAEHLTNSTVLGTNIYLFAAEDYNGVVQTKENFKWLVHVTLQFYQYKYPRTVVGGGAFYDYYKLEFKASPRAPTEL